MQQTNALDLPFVSVFTNSRRPANSPNLTSLHSPRWKISLLPSLMLPSYFVTLSLTKQHAPKGVPSWLIKEIAEVAPSVTLIVQASLDLGCIPFSWKRHWSSRYFRKGNRSEESSNRPPSPPSSVRCVNTSSTVLTLVISLHMTPSPTHNMASAKDLVTPNSYVQSMT